MNYKRRFQKYFVKQHDEADCGVACLASIIKYYEGTPSIEQLRIDSGTSREGTTILGLLHAARANGFDADGMEADNMNELRGLTGPAIVHVLINEMGHYMVFYAIAENKALLSDPDRGLIWYELADFDKVWKDKVLLTLAPNSSFVKTVKQRNEKIQWIKRLLAEDMPTLVSSLTLGICITALSLTTAIFSQKLIDQFLPEKDQVRVNLSLVIVSILLLIRIGLSNFRGNLMAYQSMTFNNRIIKFFYEKLLDLPKSFFDSRKTGDILARINDTNRIQTTVSSIAGTFVVDILIVLLSTLIIFSYSIIVGLVTCVLLALYFLTMWRFQTPIAENQRHVMKAYARSESNFINHIQSINEIKTSNALILFKQHSEATYSDFQRKSLNLARIGIKFGTISDVIGLTLMVSVFGITSHLVLEASLSIGQLVAVVTIVSGILPSASRVVMTNIQLQEARIAFDRMFEYALLPIEQQTGLQKLDDICELLFEQVSFAFAGRSKLFKNIYLNAKKGELIAILGKSGSGKSTILHLIQKAYLYDGSIRMNGIDLRDIGLNEVRLRVASVPQEPRVFNGSLVFNICLSDSKEDNKRAIEFCQLNGIDKFFQAFPQGYDTVLGEEGIAISGGQKQLVALARAIFRNPTLLLLDEPTSAMDPVTEDFIINLLHQLRTTMLIVMVTHRSSAAQRCDRIYELSSGTMKPVTRRK